MTDQKEILLGWIEEDRDHLVDFLCRFIQKETPNPPGDTREAAAFVCRLLDTHKLPYRVISPHPEMPNIISSFECGNPGRHLVFNGHLDVFPVGGEKWTYGPWSGAVVDGHIYGRGVCDMKSGTTASIFTFLYLHRIRDRLNGKLTLTAVSDEETFGPWGARFLMENHPEVHGNCCLSGEPGSPCTIRFGEKGRLWLSLTVQTRGCHGAYTHLSESAIKIACALIRDLETVIAIESNSSESVKKALDGNEEVIDRALGKGSFEIVQKVTLNIGTIHGGLKLNMVPGQCVAEADIRLPVGMEKVHVMNEVERIVARYPQVTFKEIDYTPPSCCDPGGEMMGYLRANAKALKGFEPVPFVSIGGTDARLWRYRNIPAYVYGPSPTGVGSFDERVEIEEFLHVIRTHVMSAYDYLSRR